MKCTSILATVLILGSQATAEEPAAPGLLKNMRDAYGKLTAYSDTGTLSTAISLGGQKQVLEKPFTIAFTAPSQLKVEWISTFGGLKNPHVLFSDKNGTSTYSGLLNQVRKETSLASSITRSTGTSGGSVQRVPCMLIEVMKVAQFANLADLKTEGIENVGTTACHRISATRGGKPVTLWIGQKDSLLRKIKISTQFGDIEETHDNIKVNADVAEDASAFTLPEDAEHVDRFQYKKLKKHNKVLDATSL